MKFSGKYMGCTFDKQKIYAIVYNANKIEVFDNSLQQPRMVVSAENVNGAVFDGNKLIYTRKDKPYIWIVDNENKTNEILIPYESVRIICVIRNQKACVLQIMQNNKYQYIIYDLCTWHEMFFLPVQMCIDLAWFGDNKYFCLCDDVKNISVYQDDNDKAYRYGVEFQIIPNSKKLKESGRMEIHTIETDERIDVKGNYDGTYKLPLFDKYLYKWPEQMSLSSTGKFVIYYIRELLENIPKALIIAKRESGDIYRVFPLPGEMCNGQDLKSEHPLYISFNDVTDQLVTVNLQINEVNIYSISCISDEDINKVNQFYNQCFSANRNCNTDFTFKTMLYDALHSCSCTNLETGDFIENRPRSYNGEDPYIFVSYSHKDYKLVWRLIVQLQKLGYRIFYDEGITPGTEWDAYIEHQLENASYVVSFITDNYWQSRNCLDELKYSVDINKSLLLVYLSDVQIPDGTGLRMRIGRIQNIHRSNFESEIAFVKKILSSNGLDIAKVR